ncbi:class I SAM-dependent methyltransferase [Neobacillus piezotolerans]|uniref:Class I SAM-dependent methyltransferase n=1 Tax=Neobacillus piezotolerans TaxID=2259171 RepID=A0A3D8GU92_9BACI|nr:class I SAM-dependent methyltransferase [Neobacillus piezotolerans]RDU38005.1 class I SAM-dependent methyltransferase [Neobacillus piezotolerans]
MSNIELIRKEEKLYHDFCYENYRLFEQGSWLHKPVQTVMDLLPFLKGKLNCRVLDLGCGVGRNSIPIAEEIKGSNGKVICVDLLPSAIEKLDEYRKEFNVEDVIELEQADIADYQIKTGGYDLIIAVSSLEHVSSEGKLDQVLKNMSAGTKSGGINCIILNSQVRETDLKTGEELEAMMEVNVSTEIMERKLFLNYVGWDVLKHLVKPLEYTIVRGDREVLLTTNAVTYVVRKK